MKTLLFILFTILPFTLSAQFTVKAYKATDKYNSQTIRIEIKNTGEQDLRIINANAISSNYGTCFYFSTTEKQENIIYFTFNPYHPEQRRFIVIGKGKSDKVDIPLSEVAKYIRIDGDIFVVGQIRYSFDVNKGTQLREISIKVE